MGIDQDTTKKVARLARLELKEEEIPAVTAKIDGVISWVEQLSEVDTDNVEPLANVVNSELTLRKDEITDGACPDKVLSNAPEETQGFYVVPKVVE